MRYFVRVKFLLVMVLVMSILGIWNSEYLCEAPDGGALGGLLCYKATYGRSHNGTVVSNQGLDEAVQSLSTVDDNKGVGDTLKSLIWPSVVIMTQSIINARLRYIIASEDQEYVRPTSGQPWPRPQTLETGDDYMVLRPLEFKFNSLGFSCDILEAALKRYHDIIFNAPRMHRVEIKRSHFVELESQQHSSLMLNSSFHGYLDWLVVNLTAECEKSPHQDMDEHYKIKIPDGPNAGSLSSGSIWGILRGLETFSQLLVPKGHSFKVKTLQILDFPRFSYRGIMLDTARHYLPVSKIKEQLDIMAMNKFNVLHWHMVDDQSFPYQSKAFPNLSKVGSWTSSQIFNAENIADIVEYARLRGIRVMPEFDTPGHTQSWLGQPGLLTTCYLNTGAPTGELGPIDPTISSNYDFLQKLFTEITGVFPEHFVHLGGDEVNTKCWQSNNNISAFMKARGISGQYNKLTELYLLTLQNIIANLPSKNGFIVWQEVFDSNIVIPKDTVVHFWKNYRDLGQRIGQATKAGHRVIVSAPWYLNYFKYGVDWHKYYEYEPTNFYGNAYQKSLIIGGEACMWGEYVDATNLTPRLWPRAALIGEKLWSSFSDTRYPSQASQRLEEHRCRLLIRGYDTAPLWPSYCDTLYT